MQPVLEHHPIFEFVIKECCLLHREQFSYKALSVRKDEVNDLAGQIERAFESKWIQLCDIKALSCHSGHRARFDQTIAA